MRILEKIGSTKTGTRKGSHDLPLSWFAKQCQVTHGDRLQAPQTSEGYKDKGPEKDHKDILHLGLKRTAKW